MSNERVEPAAASEGTRKGYVDATAWFGSDRGQAAGSSLADLRAEQGRHGIRLSLAHSRVGAHHHPSLGNRLAIEAAQDPSNRVAAVAVMSPWATNGPLEEIATAERAGAVAFWMEGEGSPAGRSAATAPLIQAIAKTGRPLFVRLERFGDATVIGAATAGLGIPVVLVGTHYVNVVDVLAAAEKYPHLYIETSSLAHFDALETAVGKIGHERILYGSGGPRRAAQGPLNIVLLGRISDDARRAILSGNAERLFGIAPAPVDLTGPWLPARSFDVHTHFMPGAWDVTQVPDSELVERLVPYGTRAAVTSSIGAIASDLESGNAQTVAAGAADAAQLGLLVMDPTDIVTAREHLRRWGEAPGIRGIKIHAQWSGVLTEDPRMTALFGLLDGYGRPVKIHNDGPNWEAALQSLALTHPGLKILVAHAGLGTPSLEAARVAAATDNVYLEFASSFAQLPLMRKVIRIAGPDRILYGTDAPLLDPRFVLGSYADAGFPAESLDDVYWNTAVKLFGEPRVPATRSNSAARVA